jgi:hypothetical protein
MNPAQAANKRRNKPEELIFGACEKRREAVERRMVIEDVLE